MAHNARVLSYELRLSQLLFLSIAVVVLEVEVEGCVYPYSVTH
jgi:hypothetical protein